VDGFVLGLAGFVQDQGVIFRFGPVPTGASILTRQTAGGNGGFEKFAHASDVTVQAIAGIQFVDGLFARAAILANVIVLIAPRVFGNDFDYNYVDCCCFVGKKTRQEVVCHQNEQYTIIHHIPFTTVVRTFTIFSRIAYRISRCIDRGRTIAILLIILVNVLQGGNALTAIETDMGITGIPTTFIRTTAPESRQAGRTSTVVAVAGNFLAKIVLFPRIGTDRMPREIGFACDATVVIVYRECVCV